MWLSLEDAEGREERGRGGEGSLGIEVALPHGGSPPCEHVMASRGSRHCCRRVSW